MNNLIDLEQYKAIKVKDSCAVIAGPGSGKTFTLISKAMSESEKGKKVLALTFTRSASQEIKVRAPLVRASTIHSLCYNTLRRFELDYEYLLTQYLKLPNKKRYDWVLVDEFQDLNSLEMEVILNTVKPNGKLFFVGDPYQSIFGYCEAEGNSIAKSSIKKLYLTKNYRSNKVIVDKLERINKRNLIPFQKKELRNTAILLRTNRHLDYLALHLKELGYSFTIKKRGMTYPGEIINRYKNHTPNLTLLTIHCAKGLEFQKVITFNWGEVEWERNLYYVAVSRASEEHYDVHNLPQLVKIIGEPYEKQRAREKTL